MDGMTKTLYFNAVVYYIIMFVCPMMFVISGEEEYDDGYAKDSSYHKPEDYAGNSTAPEADDAHRYLAGAPKCLSSLNLYSHLIYAIYSIITMILEVGLVLKIQRAVNNEYVLKLNKWHFVELLMGQIARFDTYLHVSFFSLLYSCNDTKFAIPVFVLIMIYIIYPIFSLCKLARMKQSFKHTLPKIEKNCDVCFVRETMMLATVLDSFCIENNIEIC